MGSTNPSSRAEERGGVADRVPAGRDAIEGDDETTTDDGSANRP
jgi:hypothetical protein